MTSHFNFEGFGRRPSSLPVYPLCLKMKPSPSPPVPTGPLLVNSSSSCSSSPSPTGEQNLSSYSSTIKTKLEEVLGLPGAGSRPTDARLPSQAARLQVPSPQTKIQSLCGFYSSLIDQDKSVFLKMLAREYGTQHKDILMHANSLLSCQHQGTAKVLSAEEHLRKALVPKYQALFVQIGHIENGVKFLVDLRSDLLDSLKCRTDDLPYLMAMNICLLDLLRLWFSVSLFQLERITWESPSDLLQTICVKEAVHPIKDWKDLKGRVSANRRCYVFMHNTMPREPVVILHTALTDSITSSIQTLFNQNESALEKVKENADDITTAIFYSITSTQSGLSGVDLGNYLIKNTVKELLEEFPRMHQFSSLSPIPGFKDWLEAEINKSIPMQRSGEYTLLSESECREIKSVLPSSNRSALEELRLIINDAAWKNDKNLVRVLQTPLMRLCARYLYLEKHSQGFARNPVANFHLRNGAVMWRLNWMGDTSDRGIKHYLGMMINYRYFLDDTESNSKKYIEKQEISASEQFLQLVRQK